MTAGALFAVSASPTAAWAQNKTAAASKRPAASAVKTVQKSKASVKKTNKKRMLGAAQTEGKRREEEGKREGRKEEEEKGEGRERGEW